MSAPGLIATRPLNEPQVYPELLSNNFAGKG